MQSLCGEAQNGYEEYRFWFKRLCYFQNYLSRAKTKLLQLRLCIPNHPRDHTKYGALTPLELCRDGHHFKTQLFVHNTNLRNVRKTKIRFVRPHVVRQWFCRGIFSMFVPRVDWSRLDGLLFWGGVGCLACLVLYLVQAPFMSIFVHDLLSSPKLFIQNGTIRKNWNGSFYFLVCSLYTLYTLNGICIDFIHIFHPFFLQIYKRHRDGSELNNSWYSKIC